MDEQRAIRKLKAGDISGLEFLVHPFQRKAVRIAYLIRRDPRTAEDVVQDCFVQVYRSIRSFDESHSTVPGY